MNPHSVLLDFRGRRICHLITVLFRPAFRETVVGRKPYFEIAGLRQSSHQKVRRSRFRIMPACAYRSTTARIRAELPKPSPPLRPRGGSKKKSARNRPEPPDGENLPAPGLPLLALMSKLVVTLRLPTKTCQIQIFKSKMRTRLWVLVMVLVLLSQRKHR